MYWYGTAVPVHTGDSQLSLHFLLCEFHLHKISHFCSTQFSLKRRREKARACVCERAIERVWIHRSFSLFRSSISSCPPPLASSLSSSHQWRAKASSTTRSQFAYHSSSLVKSKTRTLPSSLEFDTLISITTCLQMLPDMCTTTNRRTKETRTDTPPC